MVFESVVVSILNKFLGDYVENLDPNQLSVGIWGGNTELTNLVLKPSTLDALDLPIQCIYGRIGKLVLNIPWKNLYSNFVVIRVEDVYLIAAPNTEIKYDSAKEEAELHNVKMREILKVEEAKKSEADKDKPKTSFTFTEKLVTQIIKNVQINLKNIHIRYEDKTTNPRTPFSTGITLSDLEIISTDELWMKAITYENITKIYKVVNLNSLSLYCNFGDESYYNVSPVTMVEKMCVNIASKTSKPDNYTYILGPINATARVVLNQKPEIDEPAFSIPKVHLNLDMDTLFIGINKAQYQYLIALADNLSVLEKGKHYRKYRPALNTYRGHYKEWWKFAYTCILEGDVKRRMNNWDWNYMKSHRKLCKNYGKTYQKVLRHTATKEDKIVVEQCERKLDIFNIIITRQKMEMETERLSKVEKTGSSLMWMNWIWKKDPESFDVTGQGTAILKQFEDAMTPDEKTRLYKAIGYQENAAPAKYPETFVDNTCTFLLRTLEIELTNEQERIMSNKLQGVRCKVNTRVGAAALSVYIKIDDIVTEGTTQDDFVPTLVQSDISGNDKGLLEVLFETNPIDKLCGQRFHLFAQPLKIVYDATTINNVVDMFKIEDSSTIDQLQAAAGTGLMSFKEMSATGLQHAVESHVTMDLKINFCAPYIIIPHSGKYTEQENVFVVNLGTLKMYSINQLKSDANVRTMHAQGHDEKQIMAAMMKQSYDTYKLEFSNLQVMIAQSSEDWRSCIKESKITNMHIINPVNFFIVVKKCLISDDPRLPLMKVTGELPSLLLTLSNARLLLLISLATSIPLPTQEVPENRALNKISRSSSMMLSYWEMQENALRTKEKLEEKQEKSSELVQFTTLDAKFVMKEFSLHLKYQDNVESPSNDVIAFVTKRLECELLQQTYNTIISLGIGDIGLDQYRHGHYLSMIKTPHNENDYLLKVKFAQINKYSPEFHSIYKSCECLLSLDFESMHITLHQEGLLELMEFGTNLQRDIEELTETTERGAAYRERLSSTLGGEASQLKRQLSTISENLSNYGGRSESSKKTKQAVSAVIETIKFKLMATLHELAIKFESDECDITNCQITGTKVEIILKEPYTQINANLKGITVTDLNPHSIHKKILTITGQEALATRIVLYNLEESEKDRKSDILVEATMGGLRIIFLNWFIMRMLNFFNKFQTAQTKIIEASQRAAETAKQNMQVVYEKATKIALNIDLKAPDIIIPVDSQSYEALLIDLGHMIVSNAFINVDVTFPAKNIAVIDEMKLDLANMKMSRISLDESVDKKNEWKLLNELTFKLIIKRNLSSSWYKSVPVIDVAGEINTIDLLLTQADYRMIMSILSGNLAEGSTQTGEAVAMVEKPSMAPSQARFECAEVYTINEALKNPSGTSMIGSIRQYDQANTDQAAVYVFLRSSFKMDKFVITLCKGGAKKVENIQKCKREELARFSLEGFSMKLRILSNDSIVASILLVNCLLDDLRKGRENKINRLIECSRSVELDTNKAGTGTDPKLPSKTMIDVILQKGKNDIFVEARVVSVTVILAVDYLMSVADFFTAEVETLPPPPPSMNASLSVKNVPTKTSVLLASKHQQPETQFTLNLKIEKPDIILVEHMDHIDTNALILNSEIGVKLRISGSHQVINGVISDLQLFTCCFNPEKRSATKAHVLFPVTISLAGSTPDEKGLHIELLVTDIRLRVSPSIIELLNRVSVTVYGKDDAAKLLETETITDRTNVWEEQRFDEQQHWFLRPDTAIDVNTLSNDMNTLDGKSNVLTVEQCLHELCIVSVPLIVVTVEAGVGNKTVPMLVLESSFKGNVRNWSSRMNLDASLCMQMAYYNSRLALWEPLIEPVEVIRNRRPVFVPWELKVEVTMNEADDLISPSDANNEIVLQPPVMSIDLLSESMLQLTVTKTCIEVFNNLAKAFESAMDLNKIKPPEIEASYKVVNETGMSITVATKDSSFQIYNNTETVDVILETGTEIQLQLKSIYVEAGSLILTNEMRDTKTVKDYCLSVKINDKNVTLNLPVVRADKRFFPLNYRGDGKDSWGLISDIRVDEGVTLITLRSMLQVHNHFNVPIEIYYMTFRGNELASIITIQPGCVLNVPLHAVYTPTNELFFSVSGYSVTTTPYVWKDLQTNLTKAITLYCSAKDSTDATTNTSFIIKAIGEMEQVYYETTSRYTMNSTCYNIHLRPAIQLRNCLPLNIVFCIENMIEETVVEAGDMHILGNVDPGKSVVIIRLENYLERTWSCYQEISSTPPEFSVWSFSSHDGTTKVILDLGMHVLDQNGTIVMTLYCPFWMINKTGMMLTYRKSKKSDKSEITGSPKNADDHLNVLHHPANFVGPILFSFNAKNFFGKKKAAIRIEQGEWSDKFSLDVAGSSGVIVCKSHNMLYQIGVHNQLTYNGLTKQVTFTPYHVIINNAPYTIACQERDRPADNWINVESKSCMALWPKTEMDDKSIVVKIADTEEISSPFIITESHTTLLKLKNKYGGIHVDVQITEGGIYINFTSFEPEYVPAKIINHTRNTMNIWEKQMVTIKKLKSNHSLLFTWDNPSGSRVFAWEIGNQKELYNDLRKDGIGEYSINNYRIYWVCFLDGMQRILLFTENRSVAENAQSAKLFELIQREINVSIHGVGLSLINNLTKQEIMYMGIASSGVIWEQAKYNNKKFKHLNSKDSASIEMAYQDYLLDIEEKFSESGRVTIDNKIEVDFKLQLMSKPNKRKIRRTFQPGLWIQMKSSPSQFQLHAKVNRLQIDNQMLDCIFPVVLAPVAPPKSVAVKSGIKPFVEISIVQLLMKNSKINQYKYFKVLVQEFHIKVDLGFVNALLEMVQNSEYNEEETKKLFLSDMNLVNRPLYLIVSTQSLQEQKSFYDLLHFSPLKIHVSFSMSAGSSPLQNVKTPSFLHVLLEGLGVTLTDLQDVVFKLAYFERDYTFLTQKQLISEATSHYVGQSVKQLYVLVLGLDVLGNPYGLVLGITKGVEDLFYEPFQGAIQGPGEFAEGVLLGVRSLFGHTVGGAAGAMSKITGAMGKGIAALTFDEDFQRKRREFNRKPATVQEGIARGGKGLVMGVVDGVTGVFTKPISGAREEGLGGFFKGLGKGAVGLVARPTAGVVDFASGTLDTVKRATDVSEDASRLRIPRHIGNDFLIKPYTKHGAEGNKILNELEKGKYATTDAYMEHYIIIEKKEVLLLTDKRIAYLTHSDIFGVWQVDWSYTWQDLKHPSTVVPKGVCIATTDSRKRGIFGSNGHGKIILISDPEKKEELCERIESLRCNS